MSLKSRYVEHLIKNQPEIIRNSTTESVQNLISEQMISPFQVSLPKKVLTNIQQEIKSYWQLRHWTEKNKLSSYPLFKNQTIQNTPKNFSVCMSYDFHYNDEADKLELIEINTNSAFLALGLELYKFWQIPNRPDEFNEDQLVKMFINEITLNDPETAFKKIALVDESPTTQKLFSEFLTYQSIFQKHGFPTDILDIAELPEKKKYALVYNRSTDFYLQNETSKNLKNLFLQQEQTTSPNPWEYFLLADKQRLIDWNQQSDLPKPNSLLKTYDLGFANKDQIWTERKNLFIKPKNSFGSKQSYRAGSISRKTFDEVFNPGFIAQQFSKPTEIEVDLNGQKQKMKYDLRCYAYQDQLQMVIARLYQGQTTNARTEGGGFACVVFS